MKTKNSSKRTKVIPRDSLDDILTLPRPIVGLARDLPSGHVIARHQHTRSQLLYASAGVMTVDTGAGIWVVPPLRAVWIPAFTHHRIVASGHVSMRTLYLQPECFAGPVEGCCVVAVTPLLRELILYAVDLPPLYPLGGPEERLMGVILDQIRMVSVTPLKLPIPNDFRLKKIYDSLARNPGNKRSLEGWGKMVGATGRTLARRFRAETGMSFGHWRQQMRILEGLRRLALNEPVTTVALDLGYDSPSAFIAMFKKTLGKTPGRYFSKETTLSR
jgi:AraC-like DNA-binding protein/mannose-6-phosphate isomerase-like protein (cupin superfamily)